MSSLTRGAARQLRAGEVRQAIVEMDEMFMFLMSISDGSVLAVVADSTCDVGLIGYEMTLLVTRTEATLTPQLVTEMRSRLPIHGAHARPRAGVTRRGHRQPTASRAAHDDDDASDLASVRTP